jgi:hypothetical protein
MANQAQLQSQLQAQSAQLTDLCNWKPDLEARFAKLQASVADLECAHLAAAAPGGPVAPSIATNLASSSGGDIHGPQGHGERTNPGGYPSVNSTSPTDFPVTGMLSLQNPMPFPNHDPNSMSG